MPRKRRTKDNKFSAGRKRMYRDETLKRREKIRSRTRTRTRNRPILVTDTDDDDNVDIDRNQRLDPLTISDVDEVDPEEIRKTVNTEDDSAKLNMVQAIESMNDRINVNEMNINNNANNIGQQQEEEAAEDGATSSSMNPSEYLKINKIESSKDKIKNHPLSEQNIIPKLGTSSIMNGTTGQGKSTLLTNLISDERFFGAENNKYFDFKFLTSPTAQGDDVQKELGIDEEFTFTDLNEAPDLIESILNEQRKKIKDKGANNAPQILMIYDDVISNPLFMKEDAFIKSFIASRHYNMTTFICSQSWTAVPRKCRLQAKNIFFFAAPLSEVELLALEYCPPGLTKKQFYKMVEYATAEPYSFLYINKSVPMKERYRRNLFEILNIDFFKSMT